MFKGGGVLKKIYFLLPIITVIVVISVIYINFLKPKVIFKENLDSIKFEILWQEIKKKHGIDSKTIYLSGSNAFCLSISEDLNVLSLFIEFGFFEDNSFLVKQIKANAKGRDTVSKLSEQNVPDILISVDDIMRYFDLLDISNILESINSHGERYDIEFLHIITKGSFINQKDEKLLKTLIYHEGIFLKELSAQDSFQLPSNALAFYIYTLTDTFSYPKVRLIILIDN